MIIIYFYYGYLILIILKHIYLTHKYKKGLALGYSKLERKGNSVQIIKCILVSYPGIPFLTKVRLRQFKPF